MQSKRTDRICPVASLQEFFRDSVAASMARQGLTADEHTAFYVVNVLTLFARSEAFFDLTENGVELKPVARILADAVDCDQPVERQFALQRAGDISLFVAGFMSDGLAAKLVDVDYYIHMGGHAYGALSESVRGSLRGRVFGAVFAELAEKFPDFVDVLSDVRDEASGKEDIDVLRTYEIWVRTRSKRAERLLRKHGIEPDQGLDGRRQH